MPTTKTKSDTMWITDVAMALTALGGKGHLSDIYEIVLKSRTGRGNPIGKYEEWVRYALQQNSRGKGHNIFVHLGQPRSGMWGLRAMISN